MAKKITKSVVLKKGLTSSELQKLAQSGTKEAIAKIEKYIKAEKDIDKRNYAEMMLEECEFVYYEPTNEKEDDEFMLCALITMREQNLDNLFVREDAIKMRLAKLALEKKVHDKVLSKNKSKQDAWQYNWMQDFVMMEEGDLQAVGDEIAYEEAWIAEARKMITTKRYKTIPAHYLEHFDFDFDRDLEEDEEVYDDYATCSNCGDDYNDWADEDEEEEIVA